MKQILLVIVLIIGILSCGMPKEVEYPNENLKIENNMVLYKNKKYTGKISIEDEGKNVTGEINLKDGKLEGGGFYKIGDVYLLEYNIKEGKLDGKFAIKDTNDNFEMLSEYKDGKIRKFFTETELMITDFSFGLLLIACIENASAIPNAKWIALIWALLPGSITM